MLDPLFYDYCDQVKEAPIVVEEAAKPSVKPPTRILPSNPPQEVKIYTQQEWEARGGYRNE